MRRTYSVFILLPIITVLGTVTVGYADTNNPWPNVHSATANMHFSQPSNTTSKLHILGQDSKPLYLLECHLGPFEDPLFDYSGNFECRLSSLYTQDTYSTLLTDNINQTRDWESRGRFMIEEITGSCTNYPEYGRIRHFRLRGMELTLKITNLVDQMELDAGHKSGRPTIVQLDLNVTVRPDTSARSAIAEVPNYREPPYANPDDPKDFSRKCETPLMR